MSPLTTSLACLVATSLLAACATQVQRPSTPTHRVERGDLRITVREQGELQTAVQTRIASQVQGLARLIYLIPEGSIVSQGDRLAELDVGDAEEKRASQAIAVAKAEAALEQARKGFEIMENMLLATREKKAESELILSQMQLERFIPRTIPERPEGVIGGTHAEVVSRLLELVETEAARNPEAEYRYSDLVEALVQIVGNSLESLGTAAGEMANRVLRQIDVTALAQARLEIAADTLAHGARLLDAGTIDRHEFESRDIAHKSQLAETRAAWNDLELLVRFDLREEQIRLRLDVSNSSLGLESVVAHNEATRIKQEAELRSKEAELMLAMERLEHWDQQIENAIIRAPTPGLVVYAIQSSARARDPVHVGLYVYERQVLINLPDVTRVIAETRVHEAQLDLVHPSQPATIRVNAYPDRIFTGTVTLISDLPDSGSRFRNNDLRVYRTLVTLDGDNAGGALRPGMNALIEIDIDVLENVLSVPITAVQREDDAHYVWRAGPEGPRAVPVELGANNLAFVEIKSGLREGDEVFLETPPGARVPDDLAR